MEVEYAFRAPRSFSTVFGSFKGDKQNLLAAVIRIDVMGGVLATPICERGKILKIQI